MAQSFLQGCVSNCGNPNAIVRPLNYEILAPFVVMQVLDSNGGMQAQASTSIAVGNKSSPPNNTAVIKSFQLGMSNGIGAHIEIVDESLGDFLGFSKLYNTLTRLQGSKDDAKAKNIVKVQWGWQPTSCSQGPVSLTDSSCPKPGNKGLRSATHTFILLNMTLNYSGGQPKYTLECVDQIDQLYDSRVRGVLGQDGQEIKMTEAIKMLLDKRNVNVRFVKLGKNCSEAEDLKWSSEGGDATGGYMGVFQGKGRNILATVMDWVRVITTAVGKGTTYFYDSTKNPPELIIAESLKPACNENMNPDDFNIGTYIVNGGKESPVLNFYPNIKWSGLQAYIGGQAPQSHGADAHNIQGPADCLLNLIPELHRKATGAASLVGSFAGGPLGGIIGAAANAGNLNLMETGAKIPHSTDRNAKQIFQQQSVVKSSSNMLEHTLANFSWNAIQAEMRVQGDPSLSTPIYLIGRFVSIVYINPFHVQPGCSWTQDKVCNEILSNKTWIITGVSHEIKAGSYTTTLKLMLPAPGIDLASGKSIVCNAQ